MTRALLLGPTMLMLSFLGCADADAPASGETGAEEPGEPAPELALPDLEGNTVDLANFRGKVVVIDFWATWCPPCVFQVPELNKLAKAHEAAGDVVVIGVAVDVEGAEVVGPWVEEQGVDYTIVLGDEALARDFGALGFPTLVVVTPQGEIDSRHVGLLELDELEGVVAAVGG